MVRMSCSRNNFARGSLAQELRILRRYNLNRDAFVGVLNTARVVIDPDDLRLRENTASRRASTRRD